MRGRRLRWGLALAALAVAVASSADVLWPRPDRITEENCDRIQAGMTRAEVESILGCPPGDYSSWPMELPRLNFEGPPWAAPAAEAVFVGDTRAISVAFDGSGNVMEARFVEGKRQPQSILDDLLWRARRQWQRWFP